MTRFYERDIGIVEMLDPSAFDANPKEGPFFSPAPGARAGSHLR